MELGDVTDPFLVGGSGVEVAVEYVIGDGAGSALVAGVFTAFTYFAR